MIKTILQRLLRLYRPLPLPLHLSPPSGPSVVSLQQYIDWPVRTDLMSMGTMVQGQAAHHKGPPWPRGPCHTCGQMGHFVKKCPSFGQGTAATLFYFSAFGQPSPCMSHLGDLPDLSWWPHCLLLHFWTASGEIAASLWPTQGGSLETQAEQVLPISGERQVSRQYSLQRWNLTGPSEGTGCSTVAAPSKPDQSMHLCCLSCLL